MENGHCEFSFWYGKNGVTIWKVPRGGYCIDFERRGMHRSYNELQRFITKEKYLKYLERYLKNERR